MAGRPEMANFTTPGYDFDRDESRAKATWDTLVELRQRWHGNLVVKGVLDTRDALKLKQQGVDAVQVSTMAHANSKVHLHQSRFCQDSARIGG